MFLRPGLAVIGALREPILSVTFPERKNGHKMTAARKPILNIPLAPKIQILRNSAVISSGGEFAQYANFSNASKFRRFG